MTLPERTTIGAVLLLALAVGRLHGDDSASRVEALVKLHRGYIWRDNSYDDKTKSRPIIRVSLSGTNVTDADLKELSGLKDLQTLDLGRTQVTDAGLKELSGLKNLQTLDLSGTQVTDAGLKELSGLKNLRTLLLQGTKVTQAGLKELSGLTNLQTISVTKVTDANSTLSQQREGQTKEDVRTSEFKKLVSALQGQPAGLEERLSYWKERSEETYSIAEREQAVERLGYLARDLMGIPSKRPESAEGQWVTRKVVPIVAKFIDDKIPSLRRNAAIAFCYIGVAGRQTIPDLTRLLADSDDGVRWGAASALRAMGEAADKSIPDLVKMVRQDPSDDVRANAAGALCRISANGMNVLVPMLDDKDARIRRAAIASLRENPGAARQALPQLMKLLHDDDSHIRADAITAISLLQPEVARQVLRQLIELLTDDDPQLRAVAVYAIGQLKPPVTEAVPGMASLLKDKDASVRRATMQGLVTMQQTAKPAWGEMIRLFNDDDSSVRGTLARGLGGMGVEGVPTLTKLLGDKDAHVRAAAADSLGTIGPAAKDAAPALKRLLTDMGMLGELAPRVCHHAGEALAKILSDKTYLEGLPPMPVDGK